MERIEQASAVKRFARKLFYPLERKIPRELAAAVSMVVIMIFLSISSQGIPLYSTIFPLV